MKTLDESFYLRGAETVARELLGKFIVVEPGPGIRLTARIVETEAYTRDDPASHSFRGPTARCSVMFGKGGVAYVYLIYGIHECFNAVTGPEGSGEAVLIRAAEPAEGAELVWERRFPGTPFRPEKTGQLLRGPGNLCRGLGITRAAHNGASLSSGPLTLQEPGSGRTEEPAVSTRIGISAGKDRLRRFYLPGNLCVSGSSSLRAAAPAIPVETEKLK